MASTNKTTNYHLSQFVGSDKPAWLADYNQDMGKIDTQMKANADANTVTDGKADSNTTNIGTLANLTTTAKTDLVSAVNEVNSTAGTAQGTATQAATVASSAKTEADAIKDYLSITTTSQISPSLVGGNIVKFNELYYALNADGTLGKIYGRLRFNVTSTGTITLTLPVTNLNAPNQYTISCAGYFTVSAGAGFEIISAIDMQVNTNNTVTLTWSGLSVGNTVTMWLPPCLYFFTDFGDIYNPES